MRFEVLLMKTTISLLALAIGTAPVFAQEPRTGVSHPDTATIAVTPDEETTPVRKPSAAIPMTATPQQEPVYGAYVPYRGSASTAKADDEAMGHDADGQIVTAVEDRPGELGEGTLLRARTKQGLSTTRTEVGTEFTAELTDAVMKDGRVILPAGAVVHGRVTTVHGGRRISGAAMLHLEARSVVLPDGTRYAIHAQLIDTDQMAHTKVDQEGSLVRRDHPKETLAAMGLATGGGAVAGAVVGGGVGAIVGAGIGAGASTIVWLKEDRQAVLPAESLLVFSLVRPMEMTPEGETAHLTPALASPDAHVVGDSLR